MNIGRHFTWIKVEWLRSTICTIKGTIIFDISEDILFGKLYSSFLFFLKRVNCILIYLISLCKTINIIFTTKLTSCYFNKKYILKINFPVSINIINKVDIVYFLILLVPMFHCENYNFYISCLKNKSGSLETFFFEIFSWNYFIY